METIRKSNLLRLGSLMAAVFMITSTVHPGTDTSGSKTSKFAQTMHVWRKRAATAAKVVVSVAIVCLGAYCMHRKFPSLLAGLWPCKKGGKNMDGVRETRRPSDAGSNAMSGEESSTGGSEHENAASDETVEEKDPAPGNAFFGTDRDAAAKQARAAADWQQLFATHLAAQSNTSS